jgi:hypothetical protein
METALPQRSHARDTRVLSGISGVVTTLVVGAILTLSSVVAPGDEAFAATGTTVTAAEQDADVENAPFPELAVTVSQTTELVSQGIEVSWTGGKKSELPSSQVGGENFLQIAQCWGDDAANPGEPDRTTCQYGAFLTPGATRDGVREAGTVAEADASYTAKGSDYFDPTYTSIPFTAVSGETVENVKDGKKIIDPATKLPVKVDVNENRFFTKFTSNEVPWAGSGEDGTGSTKFEVQTAVQSSALGCGTPVTATDGTVSGSSCWLVIIPRGTTEAGQKGITQSGLFSDAWDHKLAVKLDFRPIGVRCAIGAAERQIAGSELVATAVASWQPKLCNSVGGAVYTIATGNEADAAALANGTAEAPLALTSNALAGEAPDALAYAPIALSGLSISFAIDREPRAGDDVAADVTARARLPFTQMNLTPRLIAKLLSNSYLDSLPYEADRKHVGYESAAKPGSNARNITFDPDFLEVNDPDWANQVLVSPSLGDMLVPQGRSDEAWALWNYVMSDADAVAFLAGEPDPWGMKVNPWSSTAASANPSGSALVLPRDSFPKADPIEQPADGPVGAVNLVTWRPYTNDFDSSAYLTLRGDGQVLGGWNPIASPPKYAKATRSLSGLQRVIGLTNTASAAKYQAISASLLNPAGAFVAPTTESLTAAAAAMTSTPGQPQVYGFDPTSETARGASTAYPLAMPVYAAVNPAMGDAEVRADYAAFIRYAAATGQEQGASVGQLPKGYAPIPQGWRDQAVAAAAVIQGGAKAPVAGSGGAPAAGGAGTAVASAGGSTRTPAAPAAAAVEPAASGAVAPALAGKPTPDDPKVSAVQAAVPVSLLAGCASALLVPFLTRTRRRLR